MTKPPPSNDEEKSPLDWVVTSQMLAGGGDYQFSATKAQQDALAKALDLLTITHCKADISLRAISDDKVKLSGTVDIAYSQACIVSLEAIDNRLLEEIETDFVEEEHIPAYLNRLANRQNKLDNPEELYDPSAPEGPESMKGGKIDIGHLVFEILSSHIDPYPRAQEAEFNWQDSKSAAGENEEQGRNSPFAVLKPLAGDEGRE